MSQPINDDSHLWASWDDYHGLIKRLTLVVYESGWKFDKILRLAWGGLHVGDQLSCICDLPLAIPATSSYHEAAGTQQDDLDIAQYITVTRGKLSGRVLSVDSLVDSGVTLERIGRHLKKHYPAMTGVRTTMLWHRACSKIKPDYAVRYLTTNPWVCQPFEKYDTLYPRDLVAWIRRRKTRSAGNGEASVA